MAYDPQVVQAIARYWKKKYGSDGVKPWERRLGRSGYATGIVESGLRNLGYGHADSQGWRQERQMYYDNPTNINASVRRYFQEAEPFARQGQNVQSIAQNAQQSAFPSRYGDVRGEAIRLFRKHALGGKAGAVPDQKAGDFNMPRMPGKAEEGSKYERLMETFARLNQAANPQQTQQTGLTGVGATLGDLQDDTANLIRQNAEFIANLRKNSVDVETYNKKARTEGQVKEGKDGKVHGGGGWGGSKGIAYAATQDLPRGSQKRATQNTASGGVSDHWVGSKDSYAIDVPAVGKTGSEYARTMAKRLGIKDWSPGTYTVHVIKAAGGKQYRVQLLWQVEGHYDHVHIGVKRVR
jgi:hypothetical protein